MSPFWAIAINSSQSKEEMNLMQKNKAGVPGLQRDCVFAMLSFYESKAWAVPSTSPTTWRSVLGPDWGSEFKEH